MRVRNTDAVFIDVETVPVDIGSEHREWMTERLYADNCKTLEARTKKAEKRFAEVGRQGLYGQIVCVVCNNIHGSITSSQVEHGGDEGSMLRVIGDYLNKLPGAPKFIGWNVRFDLRMLHQRMLYHDIRLEFRIPHDKQPWHGEYLDLMHYLDSETKFKLGEACWLYGVEYLEDIDGSQVAETWKTDPAKVIDHCEHDVRKVKELAHKWHLITAAPAKISDWRKNPEPF